ncbi:EamA family transporter [Rhizobium lentis]|uniref:EamA family transporter n=1 Tax=Rhizobium lentis TaxID=1138194 RepID=A0A9Q3M7D6_9HYPH|nr:EamA family transporter [Rhizobium lentis]MBX4955286.1 EamA family transporter [Rhizobium lentis]MBX4972794.1 EamA family transporter [Rhizobium lentis]MBX4987069.1 EamA family transporter [Rhizobium lentis]MBX4998457.1 EamA family transporter [Rhizobium lentis]MBX5005513.1 EamA family transporter [Rhizobium lentis]
MEEKANAGAGTLTAEASTAFGGVAAGGLLCLLSMSSIQFGAALSSSAITTYGPAGASWLRLAFAAIILAVVVRPRIVSYNRAQWTSALVLGATTALMTMSFFAAIERIPLGLAVAIDFLGPLSVATIGYGLSRRLVWPLIAALGVLALAHDGDGWVGDVAGILFALGAGTGWAIYIVLTKKIGASFKGLEGLSMSLVVAALVATPFGFVGAVPKLDAYGLIEMAGLAVLVPLLPYTLELIALRRMPTASFGILMSLEPAIAAIAGFVILVQPMTLLQMAGTALVVAASAGATFSARQ